MKKKAPTSWLARTGNLRSRIQIQTRFAVLLALGLGVPARAGTVTYRYDDAGRLIQADYGSGKTIAYTYDKSGNLLARVVGSAGVAGPVISAAGVVNAASFLAGPVTPGEMVTLFGSNIGPAAPTLLRLTASGLVDSALADTRVWFDGVAAPLIYVSAAQTSVVVPYAVAGKTATQVQVEYRGARSGGVTIPVVPSAPGIFTANGRQGAILNQDGSVNSSSNPAGRGSVVVLFATGEGQTDPPGVDGKLAGEVLPKPLLNVSVSIGGLAADVLYAGGAPGLVAGVLQVNARLPEGVASGNAVPVRLTIGNSASQPGVTVAVQ